MNQTTLEKQRAARVEKAEARAGIHEGHYYLYGQFVFVFVDFYPRERWLVQDASWEHGGRVVPGTTRALTDEMKAALQSWL